MNDDASVPNPHDRFVRRFLGETEQVRELVTWQLPPETVAALDLDTITPTKQIFVDQTLREDLSDLVFEVRLTGGDDAFVVLLFEHKSTPDRMVSFQVLRYIVGICNQRLRNGQPLCCVIPVVLYHGERPWTVARTLKELIDAPDALQAYIPEFTMPLVDLSQCSDEELQRESHFFAHMMLLKYIARLELPERLPGILRLFRKLLASPTGLDSFEAVLRYLVTGTERISREGLQTAVRDLLQTNEESIMPTIADQWIQEGFEKGIEKGIEKGEIIGRIRMLQEVLGHQIDSREALEKLDQDALDHLATQLDETRRRK